MSPEALEVPEGMRRLKVGRASDVWSLGCILYQMIYGSPPFHALTVYQKMKAIPDRNHIIEYPDLAVPSLPSPRGASGTPPQPQRLTHLARPVRKDVIETMQKCLQREAKERATIPQLLAEDWLAMKEREYIKDSSLPFQQLMPSAIQRLLHLRHLLPQPQGQVYDTTRPLSTPIIWLS